MDCFSTKTRGVRMSLHQLTLTNQVNGVVVVTAPESNNQASLVEGKQIQFTCQIAKQLLPYCDGVTFNLPSFWKSEPISTRRNATVYNFGMFACLHVSYTREVKSSQQALSQFPPLCFSVTRRRPLQRSECSYYDETFFFVLDMRKKGS